MKWKLKKKKNITLVIEKFIEFDFNRGFIYNILGQFIFLVKEIKMRSIFLLAYFETYAKWSIFFKYSKIEMLTVI